MSHLTCLHPAAPPCRLFGSVVTRLNIFTDFRSFFESNTSGIYTGHGAQVPRQHALRVFSWIACICVAGMCSCLRACAHTRPCVCAYICSHDFVCTRMHQWERLSPPCVRTNQHMLLPSQLLPSWPMERHPHPGPKAVYKESHAVVLVGYDLDKGYWIVKVGGGLGVRTYVCRHMWCHPPSACRVWKLGGGAGHMPLPALCR
jgi:hypothetical protein